MPLQIFLTIISSIFLLNWHVSGLSFFNPENYSPVLEKPATFHLPVRKTATTTDIDLAAESAAVLDVKDNLFIFEKDANQPHRLASITKLMTALVFLGNNPGWDKIHTLDDSDRRDGGKIYLYRGDQVTVKDLFSAMLVGSDNTATIALVHSASSTEEAFVQKMNDKAKELGLADTKFYDAVGLSDDNVSTARDIAELAKATLSNPDILQAVSSPETSFTTVKGQQKVIESTDYLLDNFSSPEIKIIGGKTGYTNLAGYCFVAKFTDKNNHEIISVILGTNSELERFRQTAKLVNWIFGAFNW